MFTQFSIQSPKTCMCWCCTVCQLSVFELATWTSHEN